MNTAASSLHTNAHARRKPTLLRTLCKSSIAVAAIAVTAPAVATAAPDPLLPQQWALANPGAIGAPDAKTQSSGAGVLVAVLDTGIQLNHPDLAANVWTNPGEVAGNGLDDDANGIIDDVHGANMLDRSANVADDNDHGTHGAGIIAARAGNGIGGAGLAHDTKILPVKVLNANMGGDTDTLARGIRYAVDEGAKILSVSINGDGSTPSLEAAVRYAGEKGAIVVASAGNNARNTDLLPSFPASLSDPAILSVAAADSDGRLWNRSNTGLLSVDLAAPGVSIVSTARGSSFHARTGTSSAAPFVAGSLALLAAARPDLTMSALRAAIVDTTRRSNLTASLLVGGFLDVGAAMHRLRPGTAWKSGAASATSDAPTLRLRTKSTTRAGARATLRWNATGADTVTRWRVSLDGRVIKTVRAADARTSQRITRAGRHKWRVVGFNDNAKKVVAGQLKFRILPSR